MKHQTLTTTPEISKRMSKVKTKRNKVEVILAKALWHSGHRYRLNYRKLPGSPDIVFTKYQIVVFVDGSFWHGKDWDIRKGKLKSNLEYWIPKIEENMIRDIAIDVALIESGWTVLHFWDTEISKDLSSCVKKVIDEIEKVKNSDLV